MASPDAELDQQGQRYPVAGIRVIGDGRLLFARALPDDALTTADWILLAGRWGEEAGRVVVETGRFVHGLLDEHDPIIVRRLTADEIERAVALGERARVAIPALQQALDERGMDATVTGLRFTFDGAAAICRLAMAPGATNELDHLRGPLRDLLGLPVRVEPQEPDANVFGGLGKQAAGPLDVAAIVRSRFARVGEAARVFAPEGLPRLGSRVATDDGPGTVTGVSMRTGLATVRLDDGREIARPPESLAAAPE